MRCIYCERPLTCDGCRAEYEPRTREEHEALYRSELPVSCTSCGEVLTCRWCGTPYDGIAGDLEGPVSDDDFGPHP